MTTPVPSAQPIKLVRRKVFTRGLFANVVLALAVTGLVAVIGLWIAGLGAAPLEWKINGPGYGQLIITSHEGRLVVGLDGVEPDYAPFRWSWRSRSPGLWALVNDESEFAMATAWAFGFAVPHWLLALALCIPIAWRWMVWHDHAEDQRRREHGLCRHCGYDVRYSTERCPECGQPIGPGSAFTPPASQQSA